MSPNGDRWLLKNLKNCVSILDFRYSWLLAAARVRLSLTVFPSPRSVAQFLPWTGEAVEKNIREYRLARFVGNDFSSREGEKVKRITRGLEKLFFSSLVTVFINFG